MVKTIYDCVWRGRKLDIRTELSDALVGDRISFKEERRAYTIQARSGRYLVCTKPFNLRKTVIYTVVDLEGGVRGTENLIFGMGAETRKSCEEMIDRLEGRHAPMTADALAEIQSVIPDFQDRSVAPTEVSRRNRIALNVVRVWR